jgi:hypothetical protein
MPTLPGHRDPAFEASLMEAAQNKLNTPDPRFALPAEWVANARKPRPLKSEFRTRNFAGTWGQYLLQETARLKAELAEPHTQAAAYKVSVRELEPELRRLESLAHDADEAVGQLPSAPKDAYEARAAHRARTAANDVRLAADLCRSDIETTKRAARDITPRRDPGVVRAELDAVEAALRESGYSGDLAGELIP